MIKNRGKQMKFGEILDCRTTDKAVIGGKYMFSDILANLINRPDKCGKGELVRVVPDSEYPFQSNTYPYQFAREIIKEKPKYRPYKDTDELKADFFKEDRLDVSKRHRPAIWVVSKIGSEFQIGGFTYKGKCVLISGDHYSMQELFDLFTYLDGSPFGIREE